MIGCAHWPEPAPAAADPRDSAGVVLDDDVDIRFQAEGGRPVAEVHVHFAARILQEAGASLGRVVVPYSPAFAEVASLRARTIAPDGSRREYSRSDAADVPRHPSWVLYSDERALVLELQPQTPGTVVEYEYVTRHHDWRFEDFDQGFGHRFPERRVRLTVTAPADWEVEHSARRLNRVVEMAPVAETLGTEKRLTWERRDVPALPAEKLAPSSRNLATVVTVRLASWMEHGRREHGPRDARELSAWVYRTVARRETEEAVQARARELVKDIGEPGARARRLYNWVRDNVTYCAIEIGIGGWRPHAASQVLGVQYGDCKDKANLLRAMLDAVGVPSRTALISFHDGYPHRFALPAVGFNHEILAVDLPGGTVLADPTSRTAPFGALPEGDEEADVLPLSEAGDAIVVAQASAAEDSREEASFELAARGADLEGTFTLVRTGHAAGELRQRLIATAERDKTLGEALKVASWRLESPVVEHGEPPDVAAPLEARGRIRLLDVLTPSATQLLRLSDLVAAPVPSLPSERRQSPLVLPRRGVTRYRFAITLPPGVDVSPPAAPAIIERPFARYELSRRREGNVLVLERTLTLREHLFAPEDYREVKGFFDAVLAAESSPVTLRRTR